MTEKLKTVCGRIKLKPGSLPKVREWAEELLSRQNEVYATLKDEGVFIESVFLEKSEEGDYLIYYMKLEDMDKAAAAVKRSLHPIDAYHKKFKLECWESSQELDLLVDFDRSSERYK